MEKHLLLIYNPLSGKRQIGGSIGDIIDIFTKGGYLVTVHPTQSKNDALTFVPEHVQGMDLIVACGGDGTLDEVVTAVMKAGADVLVTGSAVFGKADRTAAIRSIRKNIEKT